jgi:excisionase family DNA binding protein
MAEMSATELAERLGLSKARISQLVADGRLDGCYSGAGRQRRFALDRVAEALGRRLDRAQMLGNGAPTRRALAGLGAEVQPEPAPAPPLPLPPRESAALAATDPDRYELARTQKAEEEARRLRRQNLAEEGTYVLAAEVEMQTARMLSREIAQVETLMRDAARKIADQLGVDFKAVRAVLLDEWRAHRGSRAESLQGEADAAGMTAAEQAADT